MKNKPNSSWWTRERVKNGLLRFVRDYFRDDEENLPWTFHGYRNAVPHSERRRVQQFRLYPSFHIVARHYESICAAWAEVGYTVKQYALEYWTRGEVIAGLQRFHRDFGFCPTATEKYHEKSQFSERFGKKGNASPNGAYGKYPSWYGIRKFFASMREAWTAAGFDVDQWWQPWSPVEDWFILESVGVLPRSEVSELMKRTVPAIKRRLYDLGRVTAKNRWGLTVNHASVLLGIGAAVIRKYLDYGALPFYRGNKSIYLNPADLLEIREIDWSKDINSELERLIKKALIQRALKILKFRGDWRNREIYTFQKSKNYLSGRIRNARVSAFAKDLPQPPNDLNVGDWVTLKTRVRQVGENRLGIVKGVYYSPQMQTRPDGTKRCCWMASVEFPKIKRLTKAGENRIRYSLPLDCLRKSEKPDIPPEPLKMNPEAVRSRKRRAGYTARANNRFQSIKPELS